MYVIVKGDFRFGVTAVIGPFETEDEVWESYVGDHATPDEIHRVESFIDEEYDWHEDSMVRLVFNDAAKLLHVVGPYPPISLHGSHFVQSPRAWLKSRGYAVDDQSIRCVVDECKEFDRRGVPSELLCIDCKSRGSAEASAAMAREREATALNLVAARDAFRAHVEKAREDCLATGTILANSLQPFLKWESK